MCSKVREVVQIKNVCLRCRLHRSIDLNVSIQLMIFISFESIKKIIIIIIIIMIIIIIIIIIIIVVINQSSINIIIRIIINRSDISIIITITTTTNTSTATIISLCAKISKKCSFVPMPPSRRLTGDMAGQITSLSVT